MKSVILSAVMEVTYREERFDVSLEARTDGGWDIVTSESQDNAMPAPEWLEQEVADWLSR